MNVVEQLQNKQIQFLIIVQIECKVGKVNE